MKLAGIVVWYNPTKEDKENIYSYLPSLDKLYIFDNSCKKNTYSKNSKIKYIFNGQNDGIAKALNYGAEKAIKEGYHWLLTMDQDTSFPKEKMEELKKYCQLNVEKVGIICPWLNTKLHVEKPKEEIDYPLDVMTSGNLLNLKVFKKIGGFKEEFFIDGVDIEYCLRLKKRNFSIMRINKIEVEHNLANIFYKNFFNKELICMNHSYMRYYYRIRNYRYIRDLYVDMEPEFCKILVKFKSMLWCIVFYEKNKWKKIKAMWDGYKDYKKNKTGKYEN